MKKSSVLLMSGLLLALSAPAFASHGYDSGVHKDGSNDTYQVFNESRALTQSGSYDQILKSGRSNLKSPNARVSIRRDGASDSAKFFHKSKQMLRDGRAAKAKDDAQSSINDGKKYYDISQAEYFRDSTSKR